jgi:caffeoyl-CoA O-methyltransferase
MFTGTTTAALAMVPTVEKVVALELEHYLESWTRPYYEQVGVSDKIDIRIGDARASLDKLSSENTSFDLVNMQWLIRRCEADSEPILFEVFIDADKQSYLVYLHKVLEGNLLAEGGIVAVDNVAYRGAPWMPVPSEWYARSGIETDEFKSAARVMQETGDIVAEFNEAVR